MSNLSGANIGLNFKGLLNLGSTINTPLSATLQAITDGDGVASHLFLSTTEVAVRGTTNAQRLIIDANAGVGKLLSFRSGNLQRWAIRVDGTESGANAGADIAIRRYDDAGTFIDAPITLTRSTGFITLGKRVSYTGSTGTSLLNFPDAGTTAADGISFGTGNSIYRFGTNILGISGNLYTGAEVTIGGQSSTVGKLNFFNTSVLIERTGASGLKLTAGGSDGIELKPSTGSVLITPTTLTGSSATSALSIAQTWNTTGNPSLIFANVTNTASGATSNLVDLQVGGVSQFSVNKIGQITIANNPSITHNSGVFTLNLGVTQHFRSNLLGTTIGTGGLVASARLAVESTTQGFLPPRMTTTQRDLIATPAAGLMIYNTSTNRPNFFDGTSWVAL
jgi:hypothetical protein